MYIWYNKARVDKTNCNERKKEYFVHFADWFVSRERETLMCVTTTTITYHRSTSKRVTFNDMCAPSTDTHKYTQTYTQFIEKLDQNPFEYCSFSFSLLFFFKHTIFDVLIYYLFRLFTIDSNKYSSTLFDLSMSFFILLEEKM